MSEEDQIKLALRASLGKGQDESSEEDEDMYDHEIDASDFEAQFISDDDDDEPIEIDSDSDDEDGDNKSIEIIDHKHDIKGKGTSLDPVTLDAEESEPTIPSTSTNKPPIPEETHELTPEEIFATILPVDIPQPPIGDKDSTRIQFRLANGTRIVRRFKLSNTVRDIFAVVKETVEGARYEYFALTSERKKLFDMLDKTIEEAGLKNSSILVEILD